MHRRTWCAMALAVAALPAQAQDAEVIQLREQLKALQQQMRQLEKRLDAAEAKGDGASHAAPQAAPRPQAENALNPGVFATLNGIYANLQRSPVGYAIGGFVPPQGEVAPPPRGLSLGESEVGLTASIDHLFRGTLIAALSPDDNQVRVEEGYLQTTALSHGFTVKAGRFFSDVGYQNRIHAHAWDFADVPLAYRALLAGQVKDDGVQVRWVAPADLFLELGAEALRGQAYPAGGEPRDGVNAYSGFVHLGGDVGDAASWRVGLSHLQADADGRLTGEEDGSATYAFTGDSGVSVLDVVFKWAQDGNPAKRNFVLNAEFLRRNERGVLDFNDGAAASDYDGVQTGFYVQGVYQPLPRWRAGLRYDRLKADNDVATPDPAFDTLADEDAAQRWSAMVDFSNSEFSRLRLQYNRDESRPGGVTDGQWLLQYVVSIGSHPAHQF